MCRTRFALAFTLAAVAILMPTTLAADSAAEMTKNAQTALAALYAKVPNAKVLGDRAEAILVFPKIIKAGLGIGAQHGEGALLKAGKAIGFYDTSGASFGLLAGGQTYGYALFFMNANALAQLDKADGFEVGVGPTVVLMDEGKAKNITTTTAREDVYAFIFDQKGAMAGVGIQGNKVTKIHPK
jgi:lipid-binding SYLF domain-containing protein